MTVVEHILFKHSRDALAGAGAAHQTATAQVPTKARGMYDTVEALVALWKDVDLKHVLSTQVN